MYVMREGVIGTVHYVSKLALYPPSPIKDVGLAPCNREHWRRKQYQRLGCLSLSVHVAQAVQGETVEFNAIVKSLRHHRRVSQQRWQQVRVSVGDAQASTARVGALGVDELQKQLESLQQEAEGVQYRASGARARFMRLSEAAEQLRLRAALDVKAGRDEDAVRLLKEKQKVMQALEVSKKRAGVLEELYAKLNEAISIKETQLISALSCARLDMSDMGIASSADVRVVSPPEKTTERKPAGIDASLAIAAVERSPGRVEGLEVATEGASIHNGNEGEQLSSQPEVDYMEADLAVQDILTDGGTGGSLELPSKTGDLMNAEVRTDGRGYSLSERKGILSGDNSDTGGKRQHESRTGVSKEQEAMEDLMVLESLGSDRNFLEEDQGGFAAPRLGGDGMLEGSAPSIHQDGADIERPVGDSLGPHESKLPINVLNGFHEMKISEVKAELNRIKCYLKAVLAFLDLEDNGYGAGDLELQLTTLVEKRDVTVAMIEDLCLREKQSDTR